MIPILFEVKMNGGAGLGNAHRSDQGHVSGAACRVTILNVTWTGWLWRKWTCKRRNSLLEQFVKSTGREWVLIKTVLGQYWADNYIIYGRPSRKSLHRLQRHKNTLINLCLSVGLSDCLSLPLSICVYASLSLCVSLFPLLFFFFFLGWHESELDFL